MKYVLAKDLPFAKAGSSVVVLDSPITRYKRIQVSASISAPMCELHEDQLCFWIKEVKPREFWVNQQALENLDTDPNCGYIPDVKYIKVREVLE